MFTVTGCGETIEVIRGPRRRKSYIPPKRTRKRKRIPEELLDRKRDRTKRRYTISSDDIKQMEKDSLLALAHETPIAKFQVVSDRRQSLPLWGRRNSFLNDKRRNSFLNDKCKIIENKMRKSACGLPPLITPSLKRRESLIVQNPMKPLGCGYSPRPIKSDCEKYKSARGRRIWKAAVRKTVRRAHLTKSHRSVKENSRSLSILSITKTGVGKRRSSYQQSSISTKYLSKRRRSAVNVDGRVSTMVKELSRCSLSSSHMRRRSISLHELDPLRQKLNFTF